MKVEIWYCSKCEVQADKIRSGNKMYKVRCPKCGKVITHHDIIYTEIDIPKEKIEPKTLIRVWDKVKGDGMIDVFVQHIKNGIVCESANWENYELIYPSEINKRIKKK